MHKAIDDSKKNDDKKKQVEFPMPGVKKLNLTPSSEDCQKPSKHNSKENTKPKGHKKGTKIEIKKIAFRGDNEFSECYKYSNSQIMKREKKREKNKKHAKKSIEWQKKKTQKQKDLKSKECEKCRVIMRLKKMTKINRYTRDCGLGLM